MLDSRPDLDIEFPENASFEEKVEMVKTATNEQTLDLQREQVEVEEEIAKVEAAQETLNVAVPEEQATENLNKLGVSINTNEAEDFVKSAGLTGGFSLALNAETPLDNKPELPSTENVDADTPARDLTGIDQRFS